MSTFKQPFAYNTGGPISGTTQYGTLVAGNIEVDYSSDYAGLKWWSAPEDLTGYVIGTSVPSGNQPVPSGVTGLGTVQFWRTKGKTDQDFLNLANYIGGKNGQPPFANTNDAEIWLESNGYYTSFNLPTPTPTSTSQSTPTPTPTVTNTNTPTTTTTLTATPTQTLTPTITPTTTTTLTQTETPTNTPTTTTTLTATPTQTPTVTQTPTKTTTPTPTVTPSPTTALIQTNLIMNWDIQNSSSYSGSGSVITDLKGNINGTLTGTIVYTSDSPNYLTIDGGTFEYIYTANINPYLSPANTGTNQSMFLWIYPTSNGIIYSEQGSLTPDGGWYDAQIQRDSSNRFLFGVWPYTVNTAPITSGTYALNNWYYVGWTYNGTLTGYVNGSSVGSSTYSRETPYTTLRPMYFNLGYPTTTDMTTTTTTCSYRLGACQIYNVGLSGAQVLSNYNNTKAKYGL